MPTRTPSLGVLPCWTCSPRCHQHLSQASIAIERMLCVWEPGCLVIIWATVRGVIRLQLLWDKSIPPRTKTAIPRQIATDVRNEYDVHQICVLKLRPLNRISKIKTSDNTQIAITRGFPLMGWWGIAKRKIKTKHIYIYIYIYIYVHTHPPE